MDLKALISWCPRATVDAAEFVVLHVRLAVDAAEFVVLHVDAAEFVVLKG